MITIGNVAIALWCLVALVIVGRLVFRRIDCYFNNRRWRERNNARHEKIYNDANNVAESFWLLHMTKGESKKKRHQADLDRRLRRLCEAFDMETRS